MLSWWVPITMLNTWRLVLRDFVLILILSPENLTPRKTLRCTVTLWHHRFCIVARSEILAGNNFVVSCHVTSKYSQTSGYGNLSSMDTSLLRTVSNVSTKNLILMFSLKGFSLIRTTYTTSLSQRVNSYKLNLFLTATAVFKWIPNPDQVNLHRVDPV